MGCGLRKEVEGMLKFIPGNWKLECHRRCLGLFEYRVINYTSTNWRYLVIGKGCTKAYALEDLLHRWRSGDAFMDFPMPAMSREELKVKLELLDATI